MSKVKDLALISLIGAFGISSPHLLTEKNNILFSCDELVLKELMVTDLIFSLLL